jgi:hypothetical protein
MSRKRYDVRFALAALLAGLRPRETAAHAAPATPRQERFFGRPFRYLLETSGVLVPVTVALAEEAPGDGAGERRAVEADAAARRN